MTASPQSIQPTTTDALSEQIAKIDHLLGREEHDAGYSAFVYMRKIWPELRSHAALRAKVEELTRALLECREFVASMVKPAKYQTSYTISSYYPCHALIDKIDAALSVNSQHQSTPGE